MAATYTAKITRTGSSSTVPDMDDAVDAIISADGIEIGEVTLLPAQYDGRLDMWGDLTNWTDHAIQSHLETLAADERSDAMDEMVEAVRAAAR